MKTRARSCGTSRPRWPFVSGDPGTLYNAACTYGALGKKAEALETVKKAFAAGYSNRDWAAKDTDLNCLHDDPEFQKLVARPGFTAP